MRKATQAMTAKTTETPSTSIRATSPSASVRPCQTNRGTDPGDGSATRGPWRPYARYHHAYSTAGTTTVSNAIRKPRRITSKSETGTSNGIAQPGHINDEDMSAAD